MTQKATKAPPPSERHEETNRIVAIVTGANSGFGLGICHLLLSSLSLPTGTPIPYSIPQTSALAPSQRHLSDNETISKPLLTTWTDFTPSSSSSSSFPSSSSSTTSSSPAQNTHSTQNQNGGPSTSTTPKTLIPDQAPPTLTLILACRSGQKAAEAIRIIKTRHEKELRKREKRGEIIREGWREGLKIVWEKVELDSVGGEGGVFAFCDRIKKNYPHVTSLFLNAGVTTVYGLDYLGFMKQIVTDGIIWATTHPTFHLQRVGVKTRDGERGLVWSTNVLAPYIMVKELLPMLDLSPSTLPLPPRIIYTSSLEAEYSSLLPSQLKDDPELLSTPNPYQASKYLGDVVMQYLDSEINSPKESSNQTGKEQQQLKRSRNVRILIGEPGIVQTGIVAAGLGAWAWLVSLQWSLSFITLYFVRLLGSKKHPTFTTEGALPLLYASAIPDEYLLPASILPGPKYEVVASRFRGASVAFGEVDQWSLAAEEELGKEIGKRCEDVRLDWRRREG